MTNIVLMIRPRHFNFNPETDRSNAFQHKADFSSEELLLSKVLHEFDAMVKGLREAGIEVLVIEDTEAPAKYDAVFPNNWITCHKDGSIILYPMMSENRRMERREDIVQILMETYKFSKLYDFSFFEKENKFLEGTGSMILDRKEKMVYAAVSPRTNLHVLDKFCVLKDYQSLFFHSYDKDGQLIYHTNVMMSLGEAYALICLESIKDYEERIHVKTVLEKSKKEIIKLTLNQVYNFSGNCLQLKNRFEERLIVFSKTAYDALLPDQKDKLLAHGNPLIFDISTIEFIGGGSVRCMMTELFIPV